MSKFENRQELADKIEWEGGLEDALDYGIKSSDLPESETKLIAAWALMEEAFDELERAKRVVAELIPELEPW
jgi:hypothetical protein